MSALSNALSIIEDDSYDPEYVDLAGPIWVVASEIRNLRNEVDCRVEHGANSGGHLEYIRYQLDEILGIPRG